MQSIDQPTRRLFLKQALPTALVVAAAPGPATIGAPAQDPRPVRFNLKEVQGALRNVGIDGWLFYDFRANNPLARRILDMESRPAGYRRFFYFVPAQGDPAKLVHRIEPSALDHLPGNRQVYLRWQELESGVRRLVRGVKRVAMEYARNNAIPYIARVDAGTVELVRSAGVEVASSGDLIQMFEATWDDDQWQMHLEAAKHTRAAFDRAFALIAQRVRGQDGGIRESEVQRFLFNFLKENRLTAAGELPFIVAGRHTSDPHFDLTPASDAMIRRGDLVLLDIWGKLDRPRSVFSDVTRMGFVGANVPTRYAEMFAHVVRARDNAIDTIRRAFRDGRVLRGFEVDQAARQVIDRAGHASRFVHRTGHSIGQDVHGNGANMDDLETHDERQVIRRTCFSIEPGIYFEDFGVRTEVNVFIDGKGNVHVTGGEPQTEILPILTAF